MSSSVRMSDHAEETESTVMYTHQMRSLYVYIAINSLKLSFYINTCGITPTLSYSLYPFY